MFAISRLLNFVFVLSPITSTRTDTGTYRATFKIANNIDTNTLYEKWFVGADRPANIIKGHDGNSPVRVKHYHEDNDVVDATGGDQDSIIVSISNLKTFYSNNENSRMRVHFRKKGRNFNVYNKSTNNFSQDIFVKTYYRIVRIADGVEAVSFGTGSGLPYTKLSYDSNGSYFDLDASLLQSDYMYGLQFAVENRGKVKELDDIFKFRVE